MKWIGSPVAEIYGHSRMLVAYGTPILGGGEVVLRGSAMAPLERAMVVSYGLFIVTVALSVTIGRSNVSGAQINREWVT